MPNRRMSILGKFKKARASFSGYLKSEWNTPAVGDGKRAVQLKKRAAEVAGDVRQNYLPGERTLCECTNVIKEDIYSTVLGLHGRLIVTNFRLIFIYTPQGDSEDREFPQRNRLVGNDDIVHNSIDAMYKVSAKKQKKKRLMTGSSVIPKVRRLEIHCKILGLKGLKKVDCHGSLKNSVLCCPFHDFKVHRFSFLDGVTPDTVSLVIDYTLGCAFPTKQEDLFAFVHALKINVPDELLETYLPRYNNVEDWSEYLNSCNASGFRVTQFNTKFKHCNSLPECFVVPRSLSDNDLDSIVRQTIYNRCPVWSYSHSNGAAVVRMGCSLPGILTTVDSDILSHILKSSSAEPRKPNNQSKQTTSPSNQSGQSASPSNQSGKTTSPSNQSQTGIASTPLLQGTGPRPTPIVYELDTQIVTLMEVRAAYESLKSACMPGSTREFYSSDSSWFSSLEASNWLNIVSRCLAVANEAMFYMCVQARSVVLKEETCSDWSAVIGSLIQLMLDERCRTLEGFQSLVDREWVALGHRFTERCCLTDQRTNEHCPLFLLFLDCTYQLLHQFPASFQFTEIYLVSVWDCVGLGLFRTFLHNSAHGASFSSGRQGNADGGARGVYHSSRPSPAPLKSAWDWGEQFSDDQISLFYNPLYLLLNGDGPDDLNSSNGAIHAYKSSPRLRNVLDNSDIPNAARKSSTPNMIISPDNGNPSAMTTSLYSPMDEMDVGIRRRGNHFAETSLLSASSSSMMSSYVSPLSPTSRALLHDVGAPPRPQRSPRGGFTHSPLDRERRAPLPSSSILEPLCGVSSLRLWSLCYLRWLTPAQVTDGGPACEYLIQCVTVEEILHLEHKIRTLESLAGGKKRGRGGSSRPRSILVFGSAAEVVSQTDVSGAGGASMSGTMADSIGESLEAVGLNSGESRVGKLVTSSFPFPLKPAGGETRGSSDMDEYFKSSILFSDESAGPVGVDSGLGGSACLEEEVFDDEGGVEYVPAGGNSDD